MPASKTLVNIVLTSIGNNCNRVQIGTYFSRNWVNNANQFRILLEELLIMDVDETLEANTKKLSPPSSYTERIRK